MSLSDIMKDREKIAGLNKHQLIDALYWMVLGDGYLGGWKKNSNWNAYLSISHKREDQDYVYFKAMILSQLNVGYNFLTDNREGKEMVTLITKSHPTFTKLAKALYLPLGRKAPTIHSIKVMDRLGLAIFYQDDGYIKWSKGYPYVYITKTSFSQIEMMAIAKHLVDKFGIIFRLQRHAKGWDLALRRKDNEKFFDLVRPFTSECMKRKIDQVDKPGAGRHFNKSV